MEKFSSLQDEVAYLRQRVYGHEKEMEASGEPAPDREKIISQKIDEYSKLHPDHALQKGYKMLEPHKEKVLFDLMPEKHDDKILDLSALMEEKGILNVLSIIEKMNDPHLEDDFHRYLVEYIKRGLPVSGLREKTPLGIALHHTLYEISLPEAKKDDQEHKGLKEFISSMEQFYAGMMSVANGRNEKHENYFSLELALSNDSSEYVFYVSIAESRKNLFEKHMLSIYPDAKLAELPDDYNIFNEDGIAVASIAKQAKNEIFPIKTYENFEYDPLNIILNAFSKLSPMGEGAAIQILISPAADYYVKRYKHALTEIRKGTPLKKAIDIRHNLLGEISKGFKEMAVETAKDIFSSKKKDEEEKPKPIDEKAVQEIEKKIESPVLATNIRLVVSADHRRRAEEILSEMESAFNQFQNTLGNSLKFERVKESRIKETLRNFSFRLYNKNEDMPLNIRELTTLMHFPGTGIVRTGQLRQAKAGSAPAPLDIPHHGVYLGVNRHRNQEVQIYMAPEDRLRHFYVIGQTGTGKTTLLKNMIVQDIHKGEGVCFIDPHGSDVQDILARVPPERYEDVIYFDPSYTPRPMAMNMLEYDRNYPDQKIFAVNELFSIFDKLFDLKTTGGPMFEQYFRNSAMLVMEDPDSGNTLVDVSRVLSNKAFRDLKVSRCKNPIVVQFWKEIAEKAGGESALSNMVPYITSKFDVFLANDIMRPIIAQEKSSFDFREVMDKKKILLVNLSKGRLGEMNANLLGLILVGKILMAALSRVDSLHTGFPPFYLYIDEFQNITTNSISTILSEARKYKLSLHIAHQFIAQLREEIRDAVFGNVGSIVSYRVGAEDAEYLEKQFAPVFTPNDIMNQDNLNAYAKLLINGRPAKPFNVFVPFPDKADTSNLENLKQLSYLKYGADRAEVEDLIMKKYRKEPPPEMTSRMDMDLRNSLKI
jgi:hypothetical protein